MSRQSHPVRFSRLATVLALVCGLVLVAGPAPAATKKAGVKLSVPSGAILELAGKGFGHGRGMSQYGAEGAARQGKTAKEILAFYYPGTKLTAHTGRISVLIGADTSADTVIKAHPKLVARASDYSATWNLAKLKPSATTWRLNPVSATKTSIAYRVGSGQWTQLAMSAKALEFYASGQPLSLVLPGSKAAQYRGILRNAPFKGKDRDTINVLSVENYLKGVVASEMPASWKPAAVQAQAVAARTYAAHSQMESPKARHYQICDSTACQVYKGVAGEVTAANSAISATAGQIVSYAGKPAFTQFSSSSGGWTVAGTVAYQKAKADPYDGWAGNSQHSWRFRINPKKVAAAWPSIGTLTAIQVLSRDGNGAWGGRVLSLKLTGSKGSVTVDGGAFRTALGLKSTYFNLEVDKA